MEAIFPAALQYLPKDDLVRTRVIETAKECGLPISSASGG